MRLQFQKRGALKLVSRIIPHASRAGISDTTSRSEAYNIKVTCDCNLLDESMTFTENKRSEV